MKNKAQKKKDVSLCMQEGQKTSKHGQQYMIYCVRSVLHYVYA